MQYHILRLSLLALFLAVCNNESYAQTTQADTNIYEKVDVIPSYIGGYDSLSMFIDKVMNYPKCPGNVKKVSVTVNVFFVVAIDGTVGRVMVTDTNIQKCFADEAIRVVKLMSGKWIPGSLNGKSVNVKCLMPLSFLR